MRKLKRNIAAAMIMTMSLSMLPAQLQQTVVSAAQTRKITVKKTEITVNSNKGIKSALKNKNINRIILNAASIKKLTIPNGNYKEKTLVINLSEKSKVHIAKGAKFKKIILLGTVKNASLVIDEAGNKIAIASKTTISISGKAAYAELTYKTGSEAAKVVSKIELIINNKTKKTVKPTIAGKKIAVKAGETYTNSELDIEDDETAQGEANIGTSDNETSQGNATTGVNNNTTGGSTGSNAGGTTAGGGFSGGGYSGGSSNGGGSTAGSGSSSNVEKKEDYIINPKKSGKIDMGFLKYIALTFENGYDIKNTKIFVDGVDVTDELTAVDSDGTIYKWEVSSPKHAELKAVSGDKTTIIKLNKENMTGVAPVKSGRKSPEYIMTYGPMASWDYYLSNYDSAGKLRVKPSVTTFSTKLTDTKKLTDKAYYTEPAVSGENVKIKFNYTSEADKAWFDSIAAEGALELVFDNNNQYLANGNLRYERTFEEHHGKTVAVLSIPTTDQGNLTTGFYRVRIKPAGSVPIMVRIKVVNNFMPKFKIKNTIVKSGDNVYFDVKNYLGSGIEEPVEKAELVLPTGEVKELKFIDNYYMYSGLFALYNDVNRKGKEEGTSGENNTIYKGEYTLRVHFKHYNTLEKTFKVVTGKEVNTETTANNNKVTVFSSKASLLKMNGMKFDAIAGASKVSTASGGSGVGSGSNPVSANVIFNIDLLANAHIITALGIDNVYAKGIVERFNERTNIIGVYDSGDLEFFEWIDYNDRVKEEEAKGRYLTFAEYRKLSDVEKINAPSRVKEVLEDNLLGELIENGSYLGKKIEGIDGATGNVVAENEWITVGGDPEYLSKIYAIYPSKEIRDKYDYGSRNRDFAISEKKYEIKGDTLKILGSAFFNPTDYYKPYNKVLQVIAVAKDGNKKYEDLVIEATIIKPKAVSLINETGNEIKKDGVVVLTGDENYISEISEIKAGGNVLEVGTDYVIEGNKLTINGSGFLKALTKYNSSNELKVVISALGYEDYEVKVKISNLYGEATRLEKDEVTGNWRLYFNTEQEFTKYHNASMRIYGNKGSNFIENKDFTWNKEESFIEFYNLNNFTDGANNISFAPRGYRNINCTINKSDETLTLES